MSHQTSSLHKGTRWKEKTLAVRKNMYKYVHLFQIPTIELYYSRLKNTKNHLKKPGSITSYP